MSRKQTLWLSSVIWGAGFVAWGAFAFAMTRPLVIHHEPMPTTLTSFVAPAPQVVRATLPPAEPLRFPVIEITVPRSSLASVKTTPKVDAPPPPRDIEQMNCSDWRPLEQGGNAVRECQ
jgi:hypothetical protein